jgi:hypothetical protein
LSNAADQPENAAAGSGLPLACTLDPAAIAERSELLSDLAANHLLAATRTSAALELRFSSHHSALERIERMVELERRCCPFLQFSIVSSDDVLLTIETEAEAEAYLDDLDVMAQAALSLHKR